MNHSMARCEPGVKATENIVNSVQMAEHAEKRVGDFCMQQSCFLEVNEISIY